MRRRLGRSRKGKGENEEVTREDSGLRKRRKRRKDEEKGSE